MTMVAGARNVLLGLTLMLLAAAGCGNRTESEPPQQGAVIRKKVAVPKETAPQPVKPSAETAVKPQTTKPPAEPGEEAQIPVEKAKEKVSETKAVPQPPLHETKAEPPSPDKERLVPPDESGGELLAEVAEKKHAYFYDPAGKPDPFKPFFAIEAERVERVAVEQKAKKKKAPPLTPLQRIDLSQLKLVGIILSPTGNKALVEEPSGKGYIISKGTYVGMNFGRVKRILKDRVIVEEEVEDFLSGKMKLQPRELILQKKLEM